MISIEAWQQGGDHFQYNGLKVFCRDSLTSDVQAKNKPTLLLIHGFPTCSWDWQKLWPLLSEPFRLITLDMIGFGLSAKPRKHAYTIAEQANLCEALLAQRDISHYHILAHDYGDTVAQELLARRHDSGSSQIGSVVFLNGGLFPEAHQPLLIQKLLMSPIGGVVARLTRYSRFKASLDRICSRKLSDGELTTYWQLLNRDHGVQIIPKLIQYMKERRVNRERWLQAVQQRNESAPRIPIRLVDGVEDPISGSNLVERYRRLIPHADVVTLKGVGHYPQLEAPEQVAEVSLQFWQHNQVTKQAAYSAGKPPQLEITKH